MDIYVYNYFYCNMDNTNELIGRYRAEYIPQKPGMQGIWEMVESAARTCYKSEGRTEYDEAGNSITAKGFADKILNIYKHRSVAEHAAVYLLASTDKVHLVKKYLANPYTKVHLEDGRAYVSTNYRVVLDNHWKDDLKYMVYPYPEHERRYTVRVFTDRGTSAEINRHRCGSFSERSTRYVDYSNSKHNIKVMPCTSAYDGLPTRSFKDRCRDIYKHTDLVWSPLEYWLFANEVSAYCYNALRKHRWPAEHARSILPLDLETEEVITMFDSDWDGFFRLRLLGESGQPHPCMKQTAKLIYDALAPARNLK